MAYGFDKKKSSATIVEPQAERGNPTGLTTSYGDAPPKPASQPAQGPQNAQISAPSPSSMVPTSTYNTSQANNTQATARTQSYGGAYAAPVLSEGTYGFRQLQDTSVGAPGSGVSGYNPVDQSSGGYQGFQSYDAGVPDIAPPPSDDDDNTPVHVPEDPGEGFEEWDDDLGPAELENPDGTVSRDRQRELGIISSETTNYNDNAAGRRLAAGDLGYTKGSSIGSMVGTGLGFALGIPGLGLIGGKVAGDTKGKLGTFDSQGNVYSEDGARFNPITGEQNQGFLDKLNPFTDTPEYTSTGEGASHVPGASQAGLRSVAGEDSILAALNEAENPAPSAPTTPTDPYAIQGKLSPDVGQAPPPPAPAPAPQTFEYRGQQYGSQAEADQAAADWDAKIADEIDWFTGQQSSNQTFTLSDGRKVYKGQVYGTDNYQAEIDARKKMMADQEAFLAPFQEQIRQDPGLARRLQENPQLAVPNDPGAPPGIVSGWEDKDGDGFDDDGEVMGTHGPANAMTFQGEQSIFDVLNEASGGSYSGMGGYDDSGNKTGVHFEGKRGKVDYGSGRTRSDRGREGSGYGGQAKSGEWVSGDHDWSAAKPERESSGGGGGGGK